MRNSRSGAYERLHQGGGLRLPPRPPALCNTFHGETGSSITGGEGGIRTHDTLPYTRFPSVRLRPLGHLSSRSYFLRSRKNSRSIAPHSSARTPLVTATRWLRRASRRMSKSVSTAPALGSATP